MSTKPIMRAPVQPVYVRDPAKRRPWGSITREEHETIHKAYTALGFSQSAERIAQRGGFGYDEIVFLTGHPPKTWREEPDAENWPGYKEAAS